MVKILINLRLISVQLDWTELELSLAKNEAKAKKIDEKEFVFKQKQQNKELEKKMLDEFQ